MPGSSVAYQQVAGVTNTTHEPRQWILVDAAMLSQLVGAEQVRHSRQGSGHGQNGIDRRAGLLVTAGRHPRPGEGGGHEHDADRPEANQTTTLSWRSMSASAEGLGPTEPTQPGGGDGRRRSEEGQQVALIGVVVARRYGDLEDRQGGQDRHEDRQRWEPSPRDDRHDGEDHRHGHQRRVGGDEAKDLETAQVDRQRPRQAGLGDHRVRQQLMEYASRPASTARTGRTKRRAERSWAAAPGLHVHANNQDTTHTPTPSGRVVARHAL